MTLIDKFLKSLAILLLFLFICLYFFRPLETEDVWLHLSIGRFIVQNQQIPHFDPFPMIEGERQPWACLHWLGSLLFYGIFAVSGYPGLHLFRILFFVIFFACFFRLAARRLPQVLIIPLIFLMIFGMGLRSFLKPDTLNAVFIFIFLHLFFKHQESRQTQWLWGIPFIGVLWFNINLGGMVYGGAIMLVFLFSYILKFFGSWDRDSVTARDDYLKLVRDVLLVMGITLALLFLNPYGLKGVLYPFQVFGDPQFVQFYQIASYIQELEPPNYLFSAKDLWFVILFLLGLTTLLKARKNFTSALLLFIVATAMFLYAQRAAAFFTVVIGYIIIYAAHEAQFHLTWQNFKVHKILERTIYAGTIIILFFNVTHSYNRRIWIQQKFQRRASFAEDTKSPNHAVRLMLENKLYGSVLNDSQYGGYLIWHGYPQLRPFVDGRQINYRYWMDLRDTVSWPERFWPAFVEKYKIRTVLLSAQEEINAKLLFFIARQPDWQLVDVNHYTVLYVKRGEFVLSEDLDSYEKRLRAEKVPQGAVDAMLRRDKKAGQYRGNVLRDFLYPPTYFIDLTQEGITLFDLGFPAAGINRLLESIRQLDEPYCYIILEVMREHYKDNS